MPPSDKRAKLHRTRREMLELLGAGSMVGLAGCGAGGPDETGTPDDDDTTPGGGETPSPTPTDSFDITEGGTLRVAIASNIESFDPPFSADVPSAMGQSFFYEGLVTSDAKGNLFPWLAESFELVAVNDVVRADYEPHMISVPFATDDDGNPFIDTEEQIVVQHPDNVPGEDDEALVLTVNETGDAVDAGVFGMQFQYDLHEGIMFTNGEELTADNVALSYERYENSLLSAQTFDNFLHAEVVDDYTVNLYAQIPNAEAARDLPINVLPSEHIDLPDGELDPRQGTTPVGTGPWVFEEFEDSEFFVVSKNENYWLEDIGLESKDWWDGPSGFPNSPVIDEIDMTIINEDATRAAALQNDEVDLTFGITSDARTQFDNSADFDVASIESGSYLFLQYPVRVEPWDNQNVRRAVNHLIPRAAIAENIEQGWARPAWTPIPELAEGTGTTDAEALKEELRPFNEFNPDRAAELIEESGVDTPIVVQIETNSDNQDRVRKVELIAESMNQTGLFDVTVETFEFLSFVGRILSPDYWQRGSLMVVGLSGTFNPHSFCEATHHSKNFAQCCNVQNISFPELDQMLDNALFGLEVLNDPELRAQRYDEIWRRIIELSANSYIDIGVETATFNNDVKGFNAFPFQEDLLSYGTYAPQDQQISYIDRE